ncbi:MAG: hypothetical protein V1809_01220 [Planctomycetota bacterium]
MRILLFALMFGVMGICCRSREIATPHATTSPCMSEFLGPQLPPSASLYKLWGEIVSLYKIELFVVKGEYLALQKSENLPVVLKDGCITRTDKPVIEKNRYYLYGEMFLKGEKGICVYRCSLRVLSGDLKGATFNLCDGRIPESICSPYQAFYAVPESIEKEGPVNFEVVDFWGK